MQELIFQTAYRLFTSQGIQPFTMDNIASRLAISKKTLYRFFASRQDLVQQVCRRMVDQYQEAMEQAEKNSSDNLQRVLGYMSANICFSKHTSPAFFADLQKHYPLQAAFLIDALNQTMGKKLRKVLEEGIVEGIFRGNLHPQLVVAILQQHIRRDFEFAAELVNDYSKDEVFRQAKYLFLYGIIAPEMITRLEYELSRCIKTAGLEYPISAGLSGSFNPLIK